MHTKHVCERLSASRSGTQVGALSRTHAKLRACCVDGCRPPAANLPGDVFIVQFTGATLSLEALNLQVAQSADLFGSNQTAAANITVEPLIGNQSVDAVVHVRVPG